MLLINPSGLPGITPQFTLDSQTIQGGVIKLEKMLDRFTAPRKQLTTDGASYSGSAFTTGELESPDFKLYDPLISVTWPRDIVVKTGGGYVDFTSNFFTEYDSTAGSEWGLMAGNTNALPTIQTNVSKDTFPVNSFGYLLKVPFMDEQRMSQVGRSLQDMLQKGLRTNYDKMLDWNTYFGMSQLNQTGLLNNANVTTTVAATGASSGTLGAPLSRRWVNKTPQEILLDINTVIYSTWAASEFDLTGMANQILIPPAAYNYIATTPAFAIGGDTILTYLMKNNIAKDQGRNLLIFPCRQCIAAGQAVVSGTTTSGRMVAYVNDEDRLRYDETVPLTRIMTAPSPEHVSYLSAYVAKVGVVKFLYYQCVAYVDGIA